MDKCLDPIARGGCLLIEEKSKLAGTLAPLCLSSSGTGERHPDALGIEGQASPLIPTFHWLLGNIGLELFQFSEFCSKLYKWQTLVSKV